jgi:hypothetical protein
LAPAEKLPSQPEVTVDQARALILRAFPALDASGLTYKGELTEGGVRVLRFEVEGKDALEATFEVSSPGYLWEAIVLKDRPVYSDTATMSLTEAEAVAKEFLARLGVSPSQQWQYGASGLKPGVTGEQSVWYLDWSDKRGGAFLPSAVSIAVGARSQAVVCYGERRIPARIGTTPRITAEAARQAALKHCKRGTSVAEPRCVVVVYEKGSQRLVWMVQVDLGEGMHVIVDVSAISGRVLRD